MPDTSHVRIGPLHLSNTQFFAALAVLVLAALEYRRLVLLDIPLQANLGSFDVLTAALANGSIFGLVLAALFVLLAIIVLLGLGLAAAIYGCWLYLFAIATLARFGLFHTLQAMTQLDFYRYLPIEPPENPNLIQRTARKAFPSLDNQTKLARTYYEKQGGTLRPYLVRRMERLHKAVEVVRSPFIDWKTAPRGVRRTVTVSFIALVICTFPIQSISINALKQDMLERSALADEDVSRFDSIRFQWDAATLLALLENPRQMVRVLTTPPVPQGTLQIRNLSRQPTHLKLACSTQDESIQSERVFLVAEMGDWMHLAPWSDPEKRLMIRRSEVSEFRTISTLDDIPHNLEPCAAQPDPNMAKIEATQDKLDRLQNRVTRAFTADFHHHATTGRDADRISELAGGLALLRDRFERDGRSQFIDAIGRKEQALAETTRQLGKLESRLADLRRGYADLSSRTEDRNVELAQRLATHESEQAQLEAESDTLRQDIVRTTTQLGSLARRLDLQSNAAAQTRDGMRRLANDIARLEPTLGALKSAGQERSGRIDRLEQDLSSMEATLATHRQDSGRAHARLVEEIGRQAAHVSAAQRRAVALQAQVSGQTDAAARLREELMVRASLHDERLNRVLEDVKASDTVSRETTRKLAEIEGRLIGRDGTDTSGESFAGEFLNGFVKFLPDLLAESMTFPISLQGLAENAEFGGFLEYGFPTRVSGVLSDVLRDNSSLELRSCLADLSDPLAIIDFAEGRTRLTRGPAPLRDLVDLVKEGSGSTVILMRGGASYTGDPTKNLRLSEQRAEWVKGQFLRTMFDNRTTLPVELDRLARREHGLQVLAFGIGERFTRRTTHSARAVEIFVCPRPEKQEQTAEILD